MYTATLGKLRAVSSSLRDRPLPPISAALIDTAQHTAQHEVTAVTTSAVSTRHALLYAEGAKSAQRRFGCISAHKGDPVHLRTYITVPTCCPLPPPSAPTHLCCSSPMRKAPGFLAVMCQSRRRLASTNSTRHSAVERSQSWHSQPLILQVTTSSSGRWHVSMLILYYGMLPSPSRSQSCQSQQPALDPAGKHSSSSTWHVGMQVFFLHFCRQPATQGQHPPPPTHTYWKHHPVPVGIPSLTNRPRSSH